MSKKLVMLERDEQCPDCMAVLPAGTQAELRYTKQGSMIYYCPDKHRNEVKSEGMIE
jgi:hypothetical protein